MQSDARCDDSPQRVYAVSEVGKGQSGLAMRCFAAEERRKGGCLYKWESMFYCNLSRVWQLQGLHLW